MMLCSELRSSNHSTPRSGGQLASHSRRQHQPRRRHTGASISNQMNKDQMNDQHYERASSPERPTSSQPNIQDPLNNNLSNTCHGRAGSG